MRLFNYCRALLFLVLFAPSFANAAFYTWYSSFFNVRASSPQQVCDTIDGVNNSLGGFVYTNGTNTSAQCLGSSGNPVSSTNMVRQGDSCPSDTAYNSTSGSCVSTTCVQDWSGGEKVWSPSQVQCVKYPNLQGAEACAYAAGKGWSRAMTINSNSSSGPEQYVDPASQCVANVDASTADCASRVNSDGEGTYRCKVTGTYNGQFNPDGTNSPDGFCPTGDCQDVPEVPEVPTPTPSEFNDTEPCIYGSDGQGGLTCTSSSKNEKEGSAQCGTVNGVYSCISKAPQYNGIEIVSNVKTETNPDGSTKTTKTDTATSKTCKDIGSCSSSTTTTTTVTNKNGAGETTSVSGSCTGPQCPDKNTNPDGDGDGFGDCVDDDCGGGSGGTPGDVELDEVPSFGEATDTFYSRVISSPIPEALGDIKAPVGGDCPTYGTTTYYGEVDYSSHCELIEDKRSLIELIAKTLWALLAVYILLG